MLLIRFLLYYVLGLFILKVMNEGSFTCISFKDFLIESYFSLQSTKRKGEKPS